MNTYVKVAGAYQKAKAIGIKDAGEVQAVDLVIMGVVVVQVNLWVLDLMAL